MFGPQKRAYQELAVSQIIDTVGPRYFKHIVTLAGPEYVTAINVWRPCLHPRGVISSIEIERSIVERQRLAYEDIPNKKGISFPTHGNLWELAPIVVSGKLGPILLDLDFCGSIHSCKSHIGTVSGLKYLIPCFNRAPFICVNVTHSTDRGDGAVQRNIQLNKDLADTIPNLFESLGWKHIARPYISSYCDGWPMRTGLYMVSR